MTDRYWRKIEDVENDIENAMQISGILLKLKGYDDDLSKIGDNENNISTNSEQINTNTGDISDNLEKINNIENNLIVFDNIYNKTFTIGNFTSISNTIIFFYETINFNFTTNGIIKIDAKYNYFENYNLTHIYEFYKNKKIFKEIKLDDISDIVNDKFEIQAIDSTAIDIGIFYETNMGGNKTIKLVGDNTCQVSYFDNIPKTNKNKLDIASNLEQISTNKNDISSNLKQISTNQNNISSNLLKINDIKEFLISPENFKKTFNIEKQIFRFNRNTHFYTIFEKEIIHDFTKNSLLFIDNNIHYKYDNLLNDYHRLQHQYDIYDGEDNLIYRYLFNKDTYYDEKKFLFY